MCRLNYDRIDSQLEISQVVTPPPAAAATPPLVAATAAAEAAEQPATAAAATAAEQPAVEQPDVAVPPAAAAAEAAEQPSTPAAPEQPTALDHHSALQLEQQNGDDSLQFDSPAAKTMNPNDLILKAERTRAILLQNASPTRSLAFEESPAFLFQEQSSADWIQRGATYLKEIREQRPQRSKIVSYADAMEAHLYHNVQHCDLPLYERLHMPNYDNGIKVLANADYGREILDCLPYNDFLNCVANDLHEWIRHEPSFYAASARYWYRKNFKDFTTEVQNLLPQSLVNLDQVGLFKRLLQPAFRAAVLHDQSVDNSSVLSVYPYHRDKAGAIATFLQLEGVSYNLFALPAAAENTTGKKQAAKFDETCPQYLDYADWKARLKVTNPTDWAKVDRNEKKFLKRARVLNLPQVKVCKLTTGSRVAFGAKEYLHITIIPRQAPGVRRALLVLHDLVTCVVQQTKKRGGNDDQSMEAPVRKKNRRSPAKSGPRSAGRATSGKYAIRRRVKGSAQKSLVRCSSSSAIPTR